MRKTTIQVYPKETQLRYPPGHAACETCLRFPQYNRGRNALEAWRAAVADREQASAFFETAHGLHEGRADVVHDHIHAAFIGGGENGF